jgi:conjugal transfer pilus assembly protein TraB
MANNKSKTPNLDTLDIKAKKKKNIIVIVILIAIVTVLFVSIGSAFLNVDKRKVFKERKKISEDKNLKLIQNPEYKENWAITIENRMENQENKMTSILDQLKGDQSKMLKELKSIIREESEKSSYDLKKLSTNIESEISNLKENVDKQITSQNDRIDQLSLMIEKTNELAKTNSKKAEDILIGSDLLPIKQSKKTKQSLIIVVDKDGNKVEKIVDNNKIPEGAEVIKEIEPKQEEKVEEKNEDPIADIPEIKEEVKEGKTEIEPDKVEESKKANHKKIIKTVSIDTSFNENIIAAQMEISKNEEKEEEMNMTFHLMTGLSQAYMITGAYAPAFQEGDSEPLPVLFEAEGDIVMPNDHLASVEKCWLLGSAKGNMNSQTANIKLVSISCILDGGNYRIEGALSGWVIGENGIPGIHGELLHKNGAWLARTFVSGFLETFSTALAGPQASAINIGNDTGDTKTDTATSISNNALSAGTQGMSSVFNKLGDYYLKMAEQIFPIIEVKGGRTVSILLIGGEDLTVVENNSVNIANLNNNLEDIKLKKELKKDKISEQESNAFMKSISNEFTQTNEEEVPELPSN